MSGRGLGFTGGTVDKLESFAGMRMDLSAADFVRQLERAGIVITGQSADLAPADGKLYALRDASGTVPSLPLIASSVMSKKLAAGAHTIMLDVKAGSGAFMRDPAQAIALAEAMVQIGRAAGRRMAAVVSDMNQPLGRAVGNALEVREALDTLQGGGPDDFRAFAVDLAATIVGLATNGARGSVDVQRALASGAGYEAFRRLVAAQGGSTAAFDDPDRLPTARYVEPVLALESGSLERLDARIVARAAIDLGAGRERKGDPVDLAVGLVLEAKVGDVVQAGTPLARLHANDPTRLAQARETFLASIGIAEGPVERPPLVLERLTG
jgi:pyrimidine-nucleoside phosphorylase